MTPHSNPLDVYVFRHGQTIGNIRVPVIAFGKETLTEIIIGNRESPLTELGKEQAHVTGKKLKGKNIQAFYSSPLSRAFDTTVIAAREIGFTGEVVAVNDLHELEVGDYSMKTRHAVMQDPALGNFDAQMESDDYRCPNGESSKECRERFCACVRQICQKSVQRGLQAIGIGAHGFVISQLIKETGYADKSHLNNGEILCCRFQDGRLTVIEKIANEATHSASHASSVKETRSR